MTRELSHGESLLIRTDYSDDTRWNDTVQAATQPTEEGFSAGLTAVYDADFDRLVLGELAAIIGPPPQYDVFLADDRRSRIRNPRRGHRRRFGGLLKFPGASEALNPEAIEAHMVPDFHQCALCRTEPSICSDATDDAEKW